MFLAIRLFSFSFSHFFLHRGFTATPWRTLVLALVLTPWSQCPFLGARSRPHACSHLDMSIPTSSRYFTLLGPTATPRRRLLLTIVHTFSHSNVLTLVLLLLDAHLCSQTANTCAARRFERFDFGSPKNSGTRAGRHESEVTGRRATRTRATNPLLHPKPSEKGITQHSRTTAAASQQAASL